jgi:excisionase family DNA binding protein
MTPTPTPITSEECRNLIGVSLATLSRLVKAKAIPFYRVGTSKNAGVRFVREAILAWMERGGAQRGNGGRKSSHNGKREVENGNSDFLDK